MTLRTFRSSLVHRNDNVILIHLIETPLVTILDYGLDQQVTITHAGMLCDLVTALHQQIPDIGRVTGGAMNGESEDARTETTISVESKSVRETLTNAAPIPNYGRVVWRARTNSLGVSPKTKVKYIGG